MLLEDLIHLKKCVSRTFKWEDFERAMKILDKEIELKTMDPRKSKIDVQGNEMDGD